MPKASRSRASNPHLKVPRGSLRCCCHQAAGDKRWGGLLGVLDEDCVQEPAVVVKPCWVSGALGTQREELGLPCSGGTLEELGLPCPGGILEELGFPCPGGAGIAVSSPSTPPAARGHPAPSHSCFSKQLHCRWGQVGASQLGAAVQVLGAPFPWAVLTPCPPTPISLPSLFLSSAPLSSNLITCQPVLIFASQSPSWMEGKD